ncbi:MarR family transcriptional regulator [Alphaproteobacteria bacterium 46_93_T64]|nr:MarR family transcriptional regulator [Alphaproteobacteria bacterium 46_93_T64]
MDKIDRIISQWNRERPDLDVNPMSLIGRVKRIAQHFAHGMDKTFAAHNLNSASFDVLATLRRSGAPYALSPGDLLATMMVTSGTMTNRVDQLVKTGLVERKHNPEDGRSVIISLSQKGLAVIDVAVNEHVQTQARLVASLTDEEHLVLNGLLSKLLVDFEGN